MSAAGVSDKRKLTTETIPERYPNHSSTIQNAISSIAQMETELDDLATYVAEAKRKLVSFAETKAQEAKAELLDAANKEAQSLLEKVRADAQGEAKKIVDSGDKETEELKERVAKNRSQAVDTIVKAVLRV